MFGLGKGKLELTLDTKKVPFGGIINGTVTLQLKEPQVARGFFVEVIAVKERPGYDEYSPNETDVIYRTSTPLMGEGQYSTELYQLNFQVQIPQESQVNGAHVGTLGKVFGGVKVNWSITAKLDIANGRDVSKREKIKIG